MVAQAGKFTPEKIEFLRSIAEGLTSKEITELFNQRFDEHETKRCITDVMRYRGIRKKDRIIFDVTSDMIDWLSENVPGKTFWNIRPVFNEKFNCAYTNSQLKGICNKRGIKSHTVGIQEKTRKLPINTERNFKKKCVGDTVYVKIADECFSANGCLALHGATWKEKQLIIWEQVHRIISDDCAIIFLDGNRFNFELDNLTIVTKLERRLLYINDLIADDKEITKAGIAIIKSKIAIYNAMSRGLNGEERKAAIDKHTSSYRYSKNKKGRFSKFAPAKMQWIRENITKKHFVK